MTQTPAHGEVWLIDLDPGRGHEQQGKRPGLVVSIEKANRAIGMAVILPMTTRDRAIPTRVRIDPDEGGVRQPSFIICDQIRSVSLERFQEPWGYVEAATMREVCKILRAVLAL